SQRRLATAALADQAEHLPGVEGDRDVLERVDDAPARSEALGRALDFDQWCHGLLLTPLDDIFLVRVALPATSPVLPSDSPAGPFSRRASGCRRPAAEPTRARSVCPRSDSAR